MKVLGVLLALAVAAQSVPVDEPVNDAGRNFLINLAIDFFRDLILNGNEDIGTPVLDPFHLPAGNIDISNQMLSVKLDLTDASLVGVGGFRVDRADLSILTLRVPFDMTLPLVEIRSVKYDMFGDILKAIPLYGAGLAHFDAINLRMTGTLQLGRSTSGRSLIIREIRDPEFSLGGFVAKTTGYIGGGDIDDVCNAILTDLVHDYLTRFNKHVCHIAAPVITVVLNSVLEKIDSWAILFG